jgi:hypothetical protein
MCNHAKDRITNPAGRDGMVITLIFKGSLSSYEDHTVVSLIPLFPDRNKGIRAEGGAGKSLLLRELTKIRVKRTNSCKMEP